MVRGTWLGHFGAAVAGAVLVTALDFPRIIVVALLSFSAIFCIAATSVAVADVCIGQPGGDGLHGMAGIPVSPQCGPVQK